MSYDEDAWITAATDMTFDEWMAQPRSVCVICYGNNAPRGERHCRGCVHPRLRCLACSNSAEMLSNFCDACARARFSR